MPEQPRTMYFQKESGPPVYERAAGLLTPVGADEPLPPAKASPGVNDFVGAKPEEMFRFESEMQMLKRVNQERDAAKQAALEFAVQPELSKIAFSGRTFAPHTLTIEPNYVCYGRLLFEEKNCERYGWNFGPIQPLISAADFFGRCQSLPYLVFSFPFQRTESSAGYCLPGDPVPYLLYPPGLSLTGGLAQASTVVALSYIFP